MKLTDVMSNAGLALYAEIALLLFFASFSAVVLYLLFGSRRDFDAESKLPLDDGARRV